MREPRFPPKLPCFDPPIFVPADHPVSSLRISAAFHSALCWTARESGIKDAQAAGFPFYPASEGPAKLETRRAFRISFSCDSGLDDRVRYLSVGCVLAH